MIYMVLFQIEKNNNITFHNFLEVGNVEISLDIYGTYEKNNLLFYDYQKLKEVLPKIKERLFYYKCKSLIDYTNIQLRKQKLKRICD